MPVLGGLETNLLKANKIKSSVDRRTRNRFLLLIVVNAEEVGDAVVDTRTTLLLRLRQWNTNTNMKDEDTTTESCTRIWNMIRKSSLSMDAVGKLDVVDVELEKLGEVDAVPRVVVLLLLLLLEAPMEPQ